jgi:hypothetical protein
MSYLYKYERVNRKDQDHRRIRSESMKFFMVVFDVMDDANNDVK